jgi:hypothetical protein
MQLELATITANFKLDWKNIYNEGVVATVYHTIYPTSFCRFFNSMGRNEFSAHLRQFHTTIILDHDKLVELYVKHVEEISMVKGYGLSLN